MAGFLYFKPNQMRRATIDDAREWGLEYAFTSAIQSVTCMTHTPTSTAGQVFGDPARHDEGRIKMDLGTQEWVKMPAAKHGELYLGYWKDHKPTPEDLQRQSQLGGYYQVMLDGHRWLSPVVQLFDEAYERFNTALPARMALDDEGNVVPGDVAAEYIHLYELVKDYAAAMQSEKLFEYFAALSLDRVCNDAARLLQANYVVDLSEIVALGLWQINRDECQQASLMILGAIDYVNYVRWHEAAKKKTPSLVTAGG